MNKQLSGLYGISSQHMLQNTDLLFESVESALKGGMSVFQYRDKQATCQQSKDELIALKALCHQYQALFIINDNISLCRDIAADGVHLGKDDDTMRHARQTLGEQAIIGRSCYGDINLALKAQQQGADYVAFGAFFSSSTKPQAQVIDIQLLDHLQDIHLPTCGIGGITQQNAPQLINKGINMVAVINDLFNQPQIQSNAEKYSQLF